MDHGCGARGDLVHAGHTNSTSDYEIWLIGKPQITQTNTDFLSWIAELVLIYLSSVLICDLDEFVYARPYT
jgi:hypothetical protein